VGLDLLGTYGPCRTTAVLGAAGTLDGDENLGGIHRRGRQLVGHAARMPIKLGRDFADALEGLRSGG
jgi:hypothetical protein